MSVSWSDGSVSNGGVGNSFHPQAGTVTCTLWPKEVHPSSGGVGNSFHPQTEAASRLLWPKEVHPFSGRVGNSFHPQTGPTTCLRWLGRQTEKFVFRLGTVLNNEAPPLPSHRRQELQPCSSPHRPSALPMWTRRRSCYAPAVSLTSCLSALPLAWTRRRSCYALAFSLTSCLSALPPSGHAADRATPQPFFSLPAYLPFLRLDTPQIVLSPSRFSHFLPIYTSSCMLRPSSFSHFLPIYTSSCLDTPQIVLHPSRCLDTP